MIKGQVIGLFGWTKGKKKLLEDTEIKKDNVNPNNDKERKFVTKITNDTMNAESVKCGSEDETLDLGIEDIWEDEYKLFKGGGLQWSTNIAYRTKASRKTRPNSEDNFIFNTVMIQHANITANVPEVSIGGNESGDKETAKKLSDMLKFNDKRNNFREMWKKLVLDYIAFGPCIAKVEWDNNWMGGMGPQRWIGECKMSRVDRREFYPDPAIINLEERMQECSYIVHKFRKKLSDIKRMFPEVGGYITEEANEDEYQNEGGDPQQAYLIEYWHKGFPDHVTPERAKELLIETPLS